MYFYINLDNGYETRFDMGKFLEFSNDNYDPLTSNIIENIQSIPQGGLFKVKSEEHRPDQISYRIYDDTQYWWVIMLYNGILDVNDITIGTILKYPDQDELDSYYFTLKQAQLR